MKVDDEKTITSYFGGLRGVQRNGVVCVLKEVCRMMAFNYVQ
jgi:hypothetical protein